jgi:hypothetical protein
VKRIGRPRIFDEPATRTIRVRLTESQWRDLVTVAGDNGTDVSGVIREAVNEYVADYCEQQLFRRTKPAA